MSLPEGFSEFEFLQDLMRKWQNKAVREEFQDLGGEDWNPDVTVSRGAIRHACTHKDSDTSEMLLMRNDLFFLYLRKARDYQQPVYGISKDVYDESVAYRPYISLFFSQDSAAAPEGFPVIQAEHKFTLVSETESSIKESDAHRLANNIKREFASTHPSYTWTKGKIQCIYIDKPRGYNLRIYANTQQEGEQLIRKIIGIQEHPFEDDNFREVIPKKNSVNNPSGTKLIYEKQRRKPRWRPNANVRFRFAGLHIHGLDRTVMLCDTTGSFPDALEKN